MCPSADRSRRVPLTCRSGHPAVPGAAWRHPSLWGQLDPGTLKCRREKSSLTLCWNYLFDLLAIPFFFFLITIIQNGLSWRILLLCLLKSALVEHLVHLPPDGREEEINTSSCLRLAILGGICSIRGLLPLLPHLPPSLICGRSWHPDPSEAAVVRH